MIDVRLKTLKFINCIKCNPYKYEQTNNMKLDLNIATRHNYVYLIYLSKFGKSGKKSLSLVELIMFYSVFGDILKIVH